MFTNLIAKLKAWVQDWWNKHGSAFLFSTGGVAGTWQALIMSGFVEAGTIERRLVAAVVIWAAAHGFGRSVTAPPKDPDAPPPSSS